MKTISLEKAVALIPDGATLMVGGFMGVGTSERSWMNSSGKFSKELAKAIDASIRAPRK